MIEKKLAIRPNRPTQFTKSVTPLPASTAISASTGGLPEAWIAAEPLPPGAKVSISAANTSSTAMPAIRPRGRSRLGSLVSSAASGTPSMARKNQIAYGNAAQMPSQPKGRKSLEPDEPSGGMSVRFDVENSGMIATMNTSSATTAIAVMTKVTFSASPTP